MAIFQNNTSCIKLFVLFLIFNSASLYSLDSLTNRNSTVLKNDSLNLNNPNEIDNAYLMSLDSGKLIISDIIISGNDITQDEIILREMKSIKGKTFTVNHFTEDKDNIYSLGLFVHVTLLPIPQEGKNVKLYVGVQEKWYIFPSPFISFTD